MNFNLINERCLAMQVVHDTECHIITTESVVLSLSLSLSLSLTRGLWVIISHAWIYVWQKSVIFQNVGRCPQLALEYVGSLQSTYGQPFAFPRKSKLRNASLHSSQAACGDRPLAQLPYCQLHYVQCRTSVY